uniref:Uncharacterized protein n=1 Tax=Candidatus Kentrum sp. FW TaxID=2126338 RepID=A0A450THW8_9GAMM|nr:MAG: hypothetical protein BECKFW1821B_GA0114236_112111 [Candidatus Kentron sp. FW]
MSNELQGVTVKLSSGDEAVVSVLIDSDQEELVATNIFHIHDAMGSMKTLLGDIKDEIKKLGIKGGTLECSLGFTVKEGKLVSVLASGSLTGAIKVTLQL